MAGNGFLDNYPFTILIALFCGSPQHKIPMELKGLMAFACGRATIDQFFI